MSLSIHRALKNRNQKTVWPYMSSVLLINKNVPRFKDGKTHFNWLLEVTKNRRCKEIEPCVIRHVSGSNLSLDKKYLKQEFRENLRSEKITMLGKVRLCARRFLTTVVPGVGKAFDELLIDLHWGQFLASKIQIVISFLILLEVYEIPRWFHPIGFVLVAILLIIPGRIFRKTGKAKKFMRKQFEGIEIKNSHS